MCFVGMLCLVAICMRLTACVYFFDSDLYMLNVSAEVQGLKAPVNCSDFILHMYGLILLVLAVLKMLICGYGYRSFHALSILTDLMHLAYEAMVTVVLVISPLSVFLARVKKILVPGLALLKHATHCAYVSCRESCRLWCCSLEIWAAAAFQCAFVPRFSCKSTVSGHDVHNVVGLCYLCVLLPVSSEDMSVYIVSYLFMCARLLHTGYFGSYDLCGGGAFFFIPVCPQYYLLLLSVVQCVLSWLVLPVREWRVVVKNAREDVLL